MEPEIKTTSTRSAESHSTGTAEELAEQAGGVSSILAPLALAFWRMRGAFEREVGTSAATWFLLELLLREEGISQGEAGQRFEIDPSRITRISQKLESEGLLRRERDSEDNRVMRLYLTPEGRATVGELRERRERFERRARESVGEESAEELRRTLHTLTRAMDEQAE
jgi:DNA-binding MarR family transcriptional regulator